MRGKRFSNVTPNGIGATMLDVAALAGVSAQTVSRVVGGSTLVAEKTRMRVQEAIRSLNYIPNEAARNLASNSSRVVAMIIPTLSSTAFAAQVKGAIDAFAERNISVLIGNSDYSQQREEELIQSLFEQRPLGFILTGLQHSEKAMALLRQCRAPVVETWDTDGEALDLCVGFSNLDAGFDVGKMLLARGAKRIAFIGGNAQRDSRANGRFLGLARAVADAGLPPVYRVELELPMSSADGIVGLDLVLQHAPMTDAIFFSADTMALPAILECNRRGIKVPDQLAICGFGDYDLAGLVTPALTTVRTRPTEMGAHAAKLLLARLDGESGKIAPVTLQHQLIRRGSA